MTPNAKTRRILTWIAVLVAAVMIFCVFGTDSTAHRIASIWWLKWIPICLFIFARTNFSDKGTPESRKRTASYAMPGGVGFVICVLAFVVAALGILTLNNVLFERFKMHQISDNQQTTLMLIGSAIILVTAGLAGRWVWLRFAPKPMPDSSTK